MTDELLRTGQAATLLGCSRQHVVNLCDQGVLPAQSTGRHRRIKRSDIETYAAIRTHGELMPDQVRSLWLHRAVAAHVARDPASTLKLARDNARRFLNRRPAPSTAKYLHRWLDLIEEGPEPVMQVLTSPSPFAREMRQNSPFPGVLDEPERLAILYAFQKEVLAAR